MGERQLKTLTRTQEIEAQVLAGVGHTGTPSTPTTVLLKVLAWLFVLSQTPMWAGAHPGKAEVWGTWLDAVFLVLHEIGHVITVSLDGVVAAAGGGTVQMALPLLLVFYFLSRADRLAAAVALWCFGASLASVAPHIYDARQHVLPARTGLLPWEWTASTDWFLIANQVGDFGSWETVAWGMQTVGAILMWGSILWAALLLWGLWRSRYTPPKMGKYYKPLR